MPLQWDDVAGWPLPGQGATLERLRLLSGLAQKDVVGARLIEAHADADAILHELAGRRVAPGTRYGVWAANAPGHALELREGRLHGSKAWCSGATLLTHALITVGDELVEVDLRQEQVRPWEATWATAGMRGADTRAVDLEGVSCTPLGPDYLTRKGFWIGAIGVAACWYGGTVPLVDPVRRSTGPHALAHLGACAALLTAARAALREAAHDADRGHLDQARAVAVRSTVADLSTEVIRRVGRALGPAPLAQDAAHAQRIADLEVYVRQDHAERDLEVLGRQTAEESWAL